MTEKKGEFIMKEVIKKLWIWIIVGFVLIGLSSNCSDNNKEPIAYSDQFVIQIGSKNVTVNDLELTLDTPVREIDWNSYIPLRFILDWFGAEDVTYDRATEVITFKLNRYKELDPTIIEKYDPQRELAKAVEPKKEDRIINYKMKESDDISSAFAKRMSYIVLFENDNVTIQEVETVLRIIANEKILSDNPDALVVHARLESQDKKGNTTYWASIIWAPDGKWENANKNTSKSQNQFTFENRSEMYEAIKKIHE